MDCRGQVRCGKEFGLDQLALRGFRRANCSCSSRGRQCFVGRVVMLYDSAVGAVDWNKPGRVGEGGGAM